MGATVSAVPYETRYAAALREAKGTPALPSLATATTSADGRFKLTVPPTAPTFVVRTTFGGLAATTVDGVFEKSDQEDLGEISLDRGETVTGRVVDPNGKPVPGASSASDVTVLPTTTNDLGLFRFDDVRGRGAQGFVHESHPERPGRGLRSPGCGRALLRIAGDGAAQALDRALRRAF